MIGLTRGEGYTNVAMKLLESLGFKEIPNFRTIHYRLKRSKIKFSINLPVTSLKLIELLQKSRRSYKAEIVRNYLKMMKLSFEECYRVLKKNRYYLIETSPILGDLGKSAGFKKADKGKK